MRLERYVQVKKLLFIRSILILDDQSLSRKIFCERAVVIFVNERQLVDDTSLSVVHDLRNTATLFNLLNEVKNMVLHGHRFDKHTWKSRVWDRAWDIEDVYWQIQFNVCRSLDIISMTSQRGRYLTWWYLSDKYPRVMGMCKTLARLVCHASLLKADDVRFKRLNISDRVCTFCDLYEEDNVRHLVMQCPMMQPERSKMFREIRVIEDRYGSAIINNSGDVLSVLLGR